MTSSRTNLALGIFGAFLVSVGRVMGEYIVETKNDVEDDPFNFEQKVIRTRKFVTKRLVVLTFVATVIFGTGWDLILRFDNDKNSWIFGALVALSQALSQFQETTNFFRHPSFWSVFFQLCIWVSWLVYIGTKNSFLFYRWFGFASIFVSNVYYNLIRDSDNIYKKIFYSCKLDRLLSCCVQAIQCWDDMDIKTNNSAKMFHFAFHFQLFGYVLISVANNI